MESKPVKSIILDTSPILTNTPTISSLLNICDSIYTVPSVIDEVKDSAARSRLETTILPFLTTRTPKSESIQFTSQFSSKTGDRSVLSETDIQVLALAYELECEQNGGDWRLRRSPGQKGPNGSPPKKSEASPEGPTKQCVDEQDSPDMNSSSTTQDVPSDAGERPHEEPPNASVAVQGGEVSANLGDVRISEPNLDDNVDISQPRPGVPSSTEDAPGDFPSNTSASDSEGWITPSNMKKQQAKDQNASTVPILEDRVMQVATISGDFAMQNVLLQIGLNLLSPSLQRVKHIRTYILRCHACFEKVKDMSKQFCPRCGKPTLTRVSCSTNQKGEFKIHLKKNMQWNHRGDRFSIPKPVPGAANGKVGQGKGGGKGGWGQELILAEDQKEYLRATDGRKGKKETSLMDEDYLPGILTGERGRAGGRPKIGAGRNINSKRRI